MIERTYMTALTHSELDIELDLGVLPSGSGFGGDGPPALGDIAERLYGTDEWSLFRPGETMAHGDTLVALVSEVLTREGGIGVSLFDDGVLEPDTRRRELRSFAQYAVMAPVIPVENSWPAMTSLWALVSAVGGGATAGASLGMIFTPFGAVVGAVVGAGSTVLVGASRGAGDAAGQRFGRRILRAAEATDLRSRLEEIERLEFEGLISPGQAEVAKEKALETFAEGG